MQIKEYIQKKREEGYTGQEIAEYLGISSGMVSSYKNGYYPSLSTALVIFEKDEIVIHPFSKDALEYELKMKGNK